MRRLNGIYALIIHTQKSNHTWNTKIETFKNGPFRGPKHQELYRRERRKNLFITQFRYFQNSNACKATLTMYQETHTNRPFSDPAELQ